MNWPERRNRIVEEKKCGKKIIEVEQNFTISASRLADITSYFQLDDTIVVLISRNHITLTFPG
jgi:hypothetical protein